MRLFIKTCIFALGFLLYSTVVDAEKADEQNNSPPQTLEDYSQAIHLDPNYAAAYSSRGNGYLNSGNLKLACNDFRKACELGDCAYLKWAKKNGNCRQ